MKESHIFTKSNNQERQNSQDHEEQAGQGETSHNRALLTLQK
jgi:hypothetical protein